MYDEFDRDPIEGNNHRIEPEPEVIHIEPAVAAEPEIEAEAVEAEAEPEAAAPQGESSGFYHYNYTDTESQKGPNPYRTDRVEYSAPAADLSVQVKPKNGGVWRKFVLCAGLAVVFGVVGGAAFQFTNYLLSDDSAAPAQTEAQIDPVDVAQADTEVKNTESAGSVYRPTAGVDIAGVAENTMPSIVAITNKGVAEVQDLFYGRSYEQQTESAGSGVIISQNDSELLIATNNHVVDGAKELSVCFTVDAENQDDTVVQAQVKGTDPSHDLAVIAVNLDDITEDVKNKIKVAQIGDSENLKVGQQVVAIGNALGYGQSVTVGYVSALDREVTVDDITNNLIQTDAAINFGNSGGALLNTEGQLIGINSVKAAASGVEGMGYAIPMKTAQPILDELMNLTTRQKVEEAEKGFMGISPVDVSEEARQIYNMPAGAFVYEVQSGSAAEQAGIVKGDIFVKIDGVVITSKDDLFNRMDYYKAGETIEVVVAAAESGEYKERTVSITLAERSADAAQQQETQESPDTDEVIPMDPFGFDQGGEEGFSFPY